ncbi:uncharacterized protein LOC135837497 isoform X2 [Planococcus citri]
MVHLFARILDTSLPDEQRLELIRSCYFKNGSIPIFNPKSTGSGRWMITDTINIVPSPLLSRETKFVENHMGEYPVIYMDFSTLKGVYDDQLLRQMNTLIRETFRQHVHLLEYFKSINDTFAETKFKFFLNAINENEIQLLPSIPFLAEKLSEYFHRKALIIVDECDSPYNSLLLPPYIYKGDKLNNWLFYFRSVMEWWFKLKTHDYVHNIFLTGVMSFPMVSGLCDVICVDQRSILGEFNLNQFFGFSSSEVKTSLTLAEKKEYFSIHEELTSKFSYEDIANFYGGYHSMGSDPNTIFNPHSVRLFFENSALNPYWYSSDIIDSFVKLLRFEDLMYKIGQLYETRAIVLPVHILNDIDQSGLMRIKEFVTNDDIETGFNGMDSEVVLGVLCHMGYITAVKDSFHYTGYAIDTFMAKIPNEEIRITLFERWYTVVVLDRMHKNIPNPVFVDEIGTELQSCGGERSIKSRKGIEGLLAKIILWITPFDEKVAESTVMEISKVYNSDRNIFRKTFLVCNIIIDVAKKVFL